MSKYYNTFNIDPSEYCPHGKNQPTSDDLYKMRVMSCLSKSEVARKADLVRSTVTQAEKDASMLSRLSVEKLLDLYNQAINEEKYD